MNEHKNERGIAIIVVVAIMVALIMMVVALLGTVTMQSDSARAFKQDNIVIMGAFSAKAAVVDKIEKRGLTSYYASEGGDYAQKPRTYYLASPYLELKKDGTPVEEIPNLLAIFQHDREEFLDATDNVLAGFDKSLNYIDLEEKYKLSYAQYADEKIDKSEIFYTLRYDYRVLALDRTTLPLTANAVPNGNTVIDFDSCLYGDLGRGRMTAPFVNNNNSPKGIPNSPLVNFDNTPGWSLEQYNAQVNQVKVFASNIKNTFAGITQGTESTYGMITDILSDSSLSTVLSSGSTSPIHTASGTVTFENIARQFNDPTEYTGKDGSFKRHARRFSFGEYGIDVVIREETAKCKCANKLNHNKDNASCPAWKTPKRFMDMGLLFTPFNPLMVATNNLMTKFRLNKRTPTWLIAAMAAQYNNNLTVAGKTTNALKKDELAKIVAEIDKIKTNIDGDTTGGATYFNAHVNNVIQANGVGTTALAAGEKLAYSMLGVYFDGNASASKYLGATLGANYSFSGRFVVEPDSAFNTRYYRIFIYTALVNESTKESISWRNLDTVYDVVDKRVVYNRYFDEVE